MPIRTPRHAVASAVAALLLLSACATNPDGTFKQNADGTYVIDDKAKAALVGAVAGCAIGSAAGKGCVEGAVIGAVAGFLIGWYFESQKIADAKQVNQQYARSKNKNTLKPPKNDIIPAAFGSEIKDAPPDSAGQKEVQITSTTDLIGYGDKAPEVTQKYAIYDEQNKLVEEKTEKLTAVDGAGRYKSHSKFKLPASAKGKKYTVSTELASNGKTFKKSSYNVAFVDERGTIQVALASY
jgi:uncharacterized protein YcfJ